MASKEYELKQAYIGKYEWTPGSNTLLYRPLTENANDYSGNSNNGTAYGTYTFSETNGIAINAGATGVAFPSTFKPGTNFTVSCYLKNTVASQGLAIFYNWISSYRYVLCSTESGTLRLYYGNGSTSQSEWSNIYTPGNNEWHNYVFVKNGTQGTIYVDGQLLGTHTFSYNPSPQLVSGGEYSIGVPSFSTTNAARGYIKDYIMESKLWTANDVLNYYNSTKGNYQPTGEITEEFALTNTSQSIYKSGYRITQVVLEYTCSYNTSGRQDGGSFIADNYNGATSTGDAGCAVPGGSQRGYDYGNNGRWGRIYSNKINSGNGYVAFQQSSTTNAQCSVQMTFTRETLSYKVGKTYNNWLEQATGISLNSYWKTNIANIFDSVNAGAYYRGRGQNSVAGKAIVTYEPV